VESELKAWELEYKKAEKEVLRLQNLNSSDFLDFTNCFHNCVYILKGIFDISPKYIRSKLKNEFFPTAIKMMREVKMHGGDDFLKLELSGIPGMQSQGEFSMRNEGKFILFGIDLPRGDYIIGKEFITLDGKTFQWPCPVMRLYDFRKIDESNSDEKKYMGISEEFTSYNPESFMRNCISFYNGVINGT
jgi:hypothetical protein